jgi:hypothetical protein
MKASRRLAENDIITRGVTVKIQQAAVRSNYENQTSDERDLLYFEIKYTINMLSVKISYIKLMSDIISQLNNVQ